MRRTVNSTFISIDGVINHMEAWHFDYVDEESDQIALETLATSDALLMGRKTYEIYASAWPGRGGEIADKLNAMKKYVVSSTLDKADWANSTVINGDLVEEITKLKNEPGDDIVMHGYGPVAATMVEHGLLDELHLWVHPAFAGVGTVSDMLFHEGINARLDLIKATPLRSGIVHLSYQVKSPTT